ncbi:hypothetical protein Val02_06210 [Virgisporangium aliadipatigenens]|uniref:Uncharacterized protein n=1 Tax=Virgisporangium aliadipatigenens TaxID=741659 RepID=A0A8J4DMF6_9ACTN|nr:hypothetical protein [Virgisporangium aliadipatigenens]GIJ43735.1 hypothetical protein Val02_06210 [Virgisporangium aliadipatigenens]
MEDLGRAADDYILGLVGAEELPLAAAQALARGVDSPALRELAGLGRADVRDATDLFDRAMSELGRPLRAPRAVLWEQARQVAAGLLAGTATTPVAAGRIAALLCSADHLDERGRSSELATRFEVLSVDWDDYPNDRPAIAEQIKAAAREVMDQSGTRLDGPSKKFLMSP